MMGTWNTVEVETLCLPMSIGQDMPPINSSDFMDLKNYSTGKSDALPKALGSGAGET
jgi:hypothetical protein